jgi:hypothetical protein
MIDTKFKERPKGHHVFISNTLTHFKVSLHRLHHKKQPRKKTTISPKKKKKETKKQLHQRNKKTIKRNK